MKLGVDLDDVLGEYVPTFLSWFNQKYDKNVYINDINDWDLSKPLGVTKKETSRLIKEFAKSKEFDVIPPVLNARAVLETLGYKNHLITARHPIMLYKTKSWVDEYFGDLFDTVITGVKNKSVYCRDNGIDVMIDDNFAAIEGCVRNGTKGIIMNKPWNWQYTTPENCDRANNWANIYQILK